MSPSHLSSTSVSSLALVRARQWESCLFSLTCFMRFPGLGSGLSPPASLMQRPLTSPTSLVLWSGGYAAVPAIKSMLAVHLSPTSAPSWKSRPLLPSKPCRTNSALLCKSYMAAGQAGAALHTMAILQVYQAEVLKEMDEGDSVSPEAVEELRRTTHLALLATKHKTRAV